jgi:hypothetical protein
MIRVTIELWPGGDKSRARHLGHADIWNTGDHPEHPRKGNYGAKFFRASGQHNGRTATVTNHARNGLTVFALLRKVLEKAGY